MIFELRFQLFSTIVNTRLFKKPSTSFLVIQRTYISDEFIVWCHHALPSWSHRSKGLFMILAWRYELPRCMLPVLRWIPTVSKTTSMTDPHNSVNLQNGHQITRVNTLEEERGECIEKFHLCRTLNQPITLDLWGSR